MSSSERTVSEDSAGEGKRTDVGVPRRRFLKWAALGGATAIASSLGVSYWQGWLRLGNNLLPYFVSSNIVDYSKVPHQIENPVLRVAQWYDYWPGSFIESFKDYIRNKYGVSVDVVQEIYTSNEELFTWITQAGKKFDVMFPTNHVTEQMERGGLILNLNKDWLPNYDNLFDWARYDYQGDVKNEYAVRASDGSLIAVPYLWGCLGIGFRNDIGWTSEDMKSVGWDVFWMNDFKGVNLTGKKSLLSDMRFTFAAAFKHLGLSVNETDPAKINQARDALLQVKPSLFDFNTQNQAPYLVSGVVYVSIASSGDIMYVTRPHTSLPKPVDFVIPAAGSARWMDTAVIHKECRNLFLAHEFINYFLDPVQGASVADWNLYATPNAEAFKLLKTYENGYDPRTDPTLYPDPTTLSKCEYMRDVGDEARSVYEAAWSRVRGDP